MNDIEKVISDMSSSMKTKYKSHPEQQKFREHKITKIRGNMGVLEELKLPNGNYLSEATRIDIIPEGKDRLELNNSIIVLSVQDDGKTIKIFIDKGSI